MIAQLVAAPVAGPAVLTGVVAGGGRRAAYLEREGFVVALTGPGVPLMPNGVALTAPPPPAGARVRVTVGGAATWDPHLRLGHDAARRGAQVLEALGAEPPDDELGRAVAARDPERAGHAAAALIGLGPGLTPEGDDRVAATAAVLAARGWNPAWLPGGLRCRTTALSATLLELAARGDAVEPLHGLFGPAWEAALARLLRIGSSTGRAYAAGAAAAALLS